MTCSEIIDFLVKYVNSSYKIRADTRLNLTFDELKSDRDCIMFALSDKNTGIERKDITGMFVDGELIFNCYYRIMANDNGYADIDSIAVVNDLVSFIKENYKQVKTDDFYLSGVSIQSVAKLSAAYPNGVKDFVSEFSINYGRRINYGNIN